MISIGEPKQHCLIVSVYDVYVVWIRTHVYKWTRPQADFMPSYIDLTIIRQTKMELDNSLLCILLG